MIKVFYFICSTVVFITNSRTIMILSTFFRTPLMVITSILKNVFTCNLNLQPRIRLIWIVLLPKDKLILTNGVIKRLMFAQWSSWWIKKLISAFHMLNIRVERFFWMQIYIWWPVIIQISFGYVYDGIPVFGSRIAFSSNSTWWVIFVNFWIVVIFTLSIQDHIIDLSPYLWLTSSKIHLIFINSQFFGAITTILESTTHFGRINDHKVSIFIWCFWINKWRF